MQLQDLQALLIPALTEHFGESAFIHAEHRDELTITVTRDMLLDVMNFLHNHPDMQFDLLKDVCVVDWMRRNARFEVVYNVWSLPKNARVRVTCFAEEKDPHVDSICSIYPAANWYEREAYDMHGIIFDHHPDLRRMYMPEDMVDPVTGDALYPLRKDFPVMGVPGSLVLPEKGD